ncbi:MAG: hypothetical protein WCH34_12445 [Bacteroidota bacterium]
MNYCKSTTESHPLTLNYSHHLKNINDIIKEEHGTIFPFKTEVALALDKIKNEASDINIKKHCSVDMVFVIKDKNYTFQVLVELKLDCKRATNLKGSELNDKIRDSKVLLFGSGIPIYNEYCFVFNDELLGKEEMNRILSYKLNHAKGIAMSVNELKQTFFD